jgi:hypothetical protein
MREKEKKHNAAPIPCRTLHEDCRGSFGLGAGGATTADGVVIKKETNYDKGKRKIEEKKSYKLRTAEVKTCRESSEEERQPVLHRREERMCMDGGEGELSIDLCTHPVHFHKRTFDDSYCGKSMRSGLHANSS